MPVLHGDPRRGAFDPGPGPAPVRDARRRRAGRRDHRRLEIGRGTRCARLVSRVQGLQDRLPRQRRHGDVQGRVPRASLRTPAASPVALFDGMAAGMGRARGRRAAYREPSRPHADRERPREEGRGRRSRAARFRASPHSPSSSGSEIGPRRREGARGDVLLWPDTFTNRFHPGIAQAAVEVLESAGWNVRGAAGEGLLRAHLDLDRATEDRRARCSSAASEPSGRTCAAGGLVLGLEPSCTAVFRSDAPDLFPHDPDVHRLQQQTVTFAELLHDRTPGWSPPQIDAHAVAQTHCHQHAVMGFEHDTALLDAMGVDLTVLDSGCCGLAGNFGFEQGHYEVSEACAERVLLPAVRAAAPARRHPGRRLQLPDPDRTERQRGTARAASRGAGQRRPAPRIERRLPRTQVGRRASASDMTRIDRIDVAAYRVPVDPPESDGTLTWDHTTVVVVEPVAGGVRGLGFTYATRACGTLIRDVLAPVVIGLDAAGPAPRLARHGGRDPQPRAARHLPRRRSRRSTSRSGISRPAWPASRCIVTSAPPTTRFRSTGAEDSPRSPTTNCARNSAGGCTSKEFPG